jgi:hypothetical protein
MRLLKHLRIVALIVLVLSIPQQMQQQALIKQQGLTVPDKTQRRHK